MAIARVYTPTEAILQWWRKKIKNTPSNYLNRKTGTLLKKELIAIIDDPYKSDFTRLEDFEAFRLKLLGTAHDQDWTWDTPSFFLFRWLSTFLPTSITQWFPQGSRLRQLLSAGEPEERPLIKSAQIINKINSKSLNLTDFYTALFHNTEAAIIDIRNRIECWTNVVTSKEIINDILTRLVAAKKAIDPLLYSELLDQAYKKDERAVTLFFYKQYQQTQDDHVLAPETSFIELTHLASALKSLFITRFSPETWINHGLELLYLISYNRLGLTDHENPILQLLNNPTPSSPSETYRQLIPIVKNLFKSTFPAEFTQYEENQRMRRNLNANNRNNDSTLLGLKWLYTLHAEPDHLCYHLARQLSELFLCHLQRGNTLQEKISQEEVCKEALTFIFNAIFPFQRTSWNSLFDKPESLLDPRITAQRFIPTSFQQAEGLAGRFILAAQISEQNLLTSIRQFHCEDMENNLRTHWNGTKWVLHRLQNALTQELFLKAKTALEVHIVLCIADLKMRKSVDSSRTIDISDLEKKLKARLDLLSTYNIGNTDDQLKLRECLKDILTELCYLIRHPNVRINHIEWVIKDCLPQLRHDFSEKLRNELKKKCMKQHIYRAIKNDLAESAKPGPVSSCTLEDLQESLDRIQEKLQQEEPNLDNILWHAKRAITQCIHLNELKKIGDDFIVKVARFTPEEFLKSLNNYPLPHLKRRLSSELVVSSSYGTLATSTEDAEDILPHDVIQKSVC